MKLFKKEDCKYIDGYIVCGDEVVGVSLPVVRQLNKLETDLQRALHAEKHKVEPVEVTPFVRQHEGDSRIVITPVTKSLDEAIDKAKDIMDDLDLLEAASAMNDYLADIESAVAWVQSENIVSMQSGMVERFDLPMLGNPLELDEGSIVEAVGSLF